MLDELVNYVVLSEYCRACGSLAHFTVQLGPYLVCWNCVPRIGLEVAERVRLRGSARNVVGPMPPWMKWKEDKEMSWVLFCDHANEVPLTCPCRADCGCRRLGPCVDVAIRA